MQLVGQFELMEVKRLLPGMMMQVGPKNTWACILKVIRGKKGQVHIITDWRAVTVRETSGVRVRC